MRNIRDAWFMGKVQFTCSHENNAIVVINVVNGKTVGSCRKCNSVVYIEWIRGNELVRRMRVNDKQ